MLEVQGKDFLGELLGIEDAEAVAVALPVDYVDELTALVRQPRAARMWSG
jgi:hypothetical protein